MAFIVMESCFSRFFLPKPNYTYSLYIGVYIGGKDPKVLIHAFLKFTLDRQTL